MSYFVEFLVLIQNDDHWAQSGSLRKSHKLHSKRPGEYGGWEKLGSALAALQDVTRQTGMTCMLQDPIFSPLSYQWHTPNASEFQHKKEAESTVCPTWMNSWCTTPKMLYIYIYINSTNFCWYFMTFNLFFWGDIMVCQLDWCFELWLRVTGKDPRFLHGNISHRMPASFTDHLKSSAVITFLQFSWSSFKMHGIDSLCAPPLSTHTHARTHAHTHTVQNALNWSLCLPLLFAIC